MAWAGREELRDSARDLSPRQLRQKKREEHKHDNDNIPLESSLEETYYHRLNPPQGFAFQRVYTDDRSLD